MQRWMWSWAVLGMAVSACGGAEAGDAVVSDAGAAPTIARKLAQYTPVRLTADLTGLSDRERRMIPLLMEAAAEMDTIYWQQVYPPRDSLLGALADSATREFVDLNYGPWDRLDDNKSFVPGVGERAPGAAFYPADITKEEFEQAAKAAPDGGAALRGPYTLVRRDTSGGLAAVAYHQAFAEPSRRAAAKIREAAALADDASLRRYLELRASALESDDYQPSDMAWLDMKNNTLDLVIGPIETYDDALFGYKTAHEAYVLVKDKEWSKRLTRYARLLPALQRGLPVPEAYKREKPGTDSDLNAYDALYYTGQANAGSKTIAINLPNDEQVQLKKGTRRLQLKNAMQAKFDRILVPIADELIADDQRSHIKFDAFFANVMFHEVAHGLGIKNTVAGRGTVRDALKEQSGALEEGKADILGLYMITRLQRDGELPDANLDDNYVTFLAGHLPLHPLRRGQRARAGERGGALLPAGPRRVQPGLGERQVPGGLPEDACRRRLHGGRDPAATRATATTKGSARFMAERGAIPADVQSDLDRLGTKGIPVDIIFEQGTHLLAAGR